QQNSIYDAKHGCVRADAKRKNQDNENERSPSATKHSQTKANILNQAFNRRDRHLVPISLLRLFQTSQFQNRLPSRFLWTHAGTKVVLNVHTEMRLQLCIESLACAFASNHVAKSVPPQFHRPHHTSSEGTRKRATIAAACFQSRCSRCNCLLPARVSL